MFRKERRGGIERKILTSILVVGITPIILTLAVGFFVVQQAQRSAVNNALSVDALKTAGGLLLSLDSRLRTVRALARDPDVVSALTAPNALTPEAIHSLKSRLSIESQSAGDGPSTYSLYDMSGSLILTTGEFTGEEEAHADWAERIHDAEFVGFRPAGPEVPRPVARAAAPVLSPKTGQRVGFMVEDQGIASLIDFALRQNYESTDTTTLERDRYQFAYVNERGGLALIEFSGGDKPELRFQTNVDMRLQQELAGPNRQQIGRMQLSGYKFGDKKMNVYLAYHGLFPPDRGYQVYILVYRSTVATWWPIIRWAMFTILGGIIVIAIFCVIAFRNIHNNIVRPLALLNEGAQIIRQGDLELKLKIGTGDEIEELASSFNKMALALSHNIRQLEDSEEKYRSLFTSMRDGVYQTDLDGVITFINPAGAEIFGYDSVEDAAGNNLKELFLEEIDFAKISSELTKRKFIERTRVWMKRRDGRGICVELSGNRVLDDEGQPVGIEVIFRDVTTGVRLEQQARERSERISAINQIANVINSSLEAGRLHESLVVELNKMVNFDYAAVSMYDEQADHFETLELWPERAGGSGSGIGVRRDGETSCAAWVAREKRYLLINDLLGEGDAHAGEFPAQIASCLCMPLHATGRIMGTLNLGSFLLSAFSQHDIEVLGEISPHIAVAMRNARLLENLQQSLEEVTRARERLHEVNEELKTLDEMKTNLLSNVSHELRTPLVAVMGYTDMIFNRKVGPINEIQAEYLGIILRNVEKLVALIENLLDFSRLYRGTEKLVFDTFDLLDCVRISMQTIQPIADSRSIALNLVASHDAALMEGDKGKMGQVFNNLLSNAVKFNHTGGTVIIDINKRDDTIEVAVTDTGIGIPPEALDKVFTRFYQYDSSSTRRYGGTGIGLSIAQDVVRLHGSRITVTSEVGKGSVFRFVLPLSAAHAEEAAGTLAPPLPSNTHLLIELITRDRTLNAQLRDLLAPEGMDLIHASNAPDAVALAQKYTPACLLVDMEVSGKGRGLLDDLLADPVAAKIPIIIMTNDDKLYEAYSVNVASRVKRDFRKSSLLGGIHYALGQAATLVSQVGSKILCVDDDPEILVFLSRCLEAEGYNIDHCSSGQEALEAVATLKYGLVLLDIAMPGLDGWEVCRRIKFDPALAGIRVYFLTAKPIDRTQKRVQEVGADGYFLKPFRGDDLIDLVKDLFPQPRAEEA